MKCILLHGLGQGPSDWNGSIQHFDTNFEVSCPALFEWLHGTEFCYANLYQKLEEYCDQYEEPFILGGLSLGGILALQYAIEHGNKVGALIVIGAQFSMPKRLLKVQNLLYRLLPNKAFEKIGASKKEIINLSTSMVNLDFTDNLKDIHCRTLIVCGENDKANYSAAVQLHKLIPNSTFFAVPGAGHVVNKDNPNALGEIINSFLREAPLTRQ